MLRLFTVVAGALLLVGCDGDRELREWTPEDHGQPEQAQMDPSRIPGNQPTGTPAERAAAALWIMQCARCHGRGGRGDGPERPPGVDMADFTTAEFQQARSDGELAAVIVQGQGEMPEFGDQLPAQAITALVGHIRRFGGGAGAPSPETQPEPSPEQPEPSPEQPEQPEAGSAPQPAQPAPAKRPAPAQPAPEQPEAGSAPQPDGPAPGGE